MILAHRQSRYPSRLRLHRSLVENSRARCIVRFLEKLVNLGEQERLTLRWGTPFVHCERATRYLGCLAFGCDVRYGKIALLVKGVKFRAGQLPTSAVHLALLNTGVSRRSRLHGQGGHGRTRGNA